MINQLLGNLTVTENGKDTGVLSLSYTGEDKDQIRAILDSILRYPGCGAPQATARPGISGF